MCILTNKSGGLKRKYTILLAFNGVANQCLISIGNNSSTNYFIQLNPVKKDTVLIENLLKITFFLGPAVTKAKEKRC